MQEELLPVFPLAVVLLPEADLPLHIFEERYKEMIGEAIAGNTEFGVVLAANGGIARAGCTAAVERVLQEYHDGRLDILSAGRRRFMIDSIDNEKPYLRAGVTFFDDEDPLAPLELRRKAIEICSPFSAGETAELDEAHPRLSFQLAAPVSDLEFRQNLLLNRSEPDRLRRLIEYAPAYMEKVRRITHVKSVAPSNGHSHLPPDMEGV
jgi:hypothetical protein